MASDIEDIIEEIEEYVEGCKPAAFSSTKIVVNRDDLENLLEELRSRTPVEIRQYQKVISNQEAILADAKKKAEAIIAEAQIQTNELVSEHQIMQQAYAQANEVVMIATKNAQELLDKATMDANEIRSGAIEYADSLLKVIQDVIFRSIDTTKSRAENYLTTM
jgi:cell division septum initiation protein DivIVA